MIQILTNLPSNMVGFKATGNVTEEDFNTTVLPAVKELADKTDSINYMLVLDTSLKNFTPGAWFRDAWMGIRHLTKWNRAAIVSNDESIRTFTDFFSYLVPGEFKGFEHKDIQKAISWTSGQHIET